VALMMMKGMPFDFWMFLGFIMMLGVMMVAAPGVPGGAIMAALGVLAAMLGFGEQEQALMIALYITMDNFGTACNVTGDGAIALVIDKLFNKKVVLRKELYFPEGINMGEDAIFILRYLNVVSNVAIVNQLDYIVRHTEGSLSSKYYSFDSEYLCYKEWRRLLVKFFSRWKSESEAIALAWGNRVEGQFRRAMLSVYRSGKYHSIKEQIECLVKIDEKDLYEYRRYAKPDKWRRKLNWWLICHRLFLPYCLLGKMDRYYEK